MSNVEGAHFWCAPDYPVPEKVSVDEAESQGQGRSPAEVDAAAAQALAEQIAAWSDGFEHG